MKPSAPGPAAPLVRLLIIVAVIAFGYWSGTWLRNQPDTVADPSAKPSLQPSASPSPRVTPTPRPYSLTIPAQRAATYAASDVVPETELVEREGYREQEVSFYADGLREYAQVLLPASKRPAGGYPAIILVHGYVPPAIYSTDEAFYTGVAAGFARQGFAVIKPDLRGHGRSWGIPEGAYYSAGYVTDVLSLKASLQNYEPVNATRVSLLGHSMGAHVALNAAVAKPDAFDAVVLAAGSVGRFSDMYSNWRANSDFGNPVTAGIRQRVITLFGAPGDDPFWRSVDAYDYLRDIKSPVLIAHDRDDDTVPYRFSSELDTALTAAGRKHEFKTYSGGHSFIAAPESSFTVDTAAFINGATQAVITPTPSPKR